MMASPDLCGRCVRYWVEYTLTKMDHVRLVQAQETRWSLHLEAKRQLAAARMEAAALHIHEHLADAHCQQPPVMMAACG
jgi:hypothetical protein